MKEGLAYRLGWYGPRAPLGVYLSPESSTYGLLRTHEKQGQLQVISWQTTGDKEELLSWIAERKGQPIALFLNDPLLLEKWIPLEGNLMAQTLGVGVENPESFWSQSHPHDGGRWASVLSKQSWQGWQEVFAQWQSQIVHANISPMVLHSILPALESYDPNKRYGIRDLGPEGEEVIELELLSELLRLPKEGLLAYGAVLGWLSGGSSIDLIQAGTERKIRQINLGLKAASILVLGIVFGWIGFMGLKAWNETQISHLEAELSAQAPLLQTLRSLEEEVEGLQPQDASKLGSSHAATRLDEIFHTAETSWTLSHIYLNPDQATLKQIDRSLDTQPNLVVIGSVASMQSLTSLIGKLEAIPWASVSLWKTSFALSKGQQTFTLLISWS